jgi:hypothetical protein
VSVRRPEEPRATYLAFLVEDEECLGWVSDGFPTGDSPHRYHLVGFWLDRVRVRLSATSCAKADPDACTTTIDSSVIVAVVARGDVR